MKRKGYKFAIAWIALNDSAGDVVESPEELILTTVCLVADVFGKDQRQVAKDVFNYRVKNGLIYEENNKE